MDIEAVVTDLFRTGMPYKDIKAILHNVYSFKISIRQLKRLLSKYGLWRKKNFTDLSAIVDFIESQLRTSGQMHGYRWLHIKCLMYGFTVTRETVRQITRYLDPVGVDIRSRRRLRRRNYHAKGPNYIWHADGYDKLKPYGLCIHGCIDGFSRKIIWMEVSHTNNDPFVTAGYFFDALKNVGGCPTRVRVDCGTENTNIEAMQLVLRNGNPGCFLYGTSQHNQRIESWWGILRRECIQFWMNVFSELKDNGYFSAEWFEKDLIRICFGELIQVSF